MAAARKTNDGAAHSETQAASRSPEAPETAAPAAPTPPVPPTPACPTCGAELELYAGINPHKVGQGWCPICRARKPLEG